MWKIIAKYCLINLLSYLEYDQAKIFLYRTTKQFRRQIIQGIYDIKNVCLNDPCGKYFKFNLFYHQDNFYMEAKVKDKIQKKAGFQGNVQLNIQILSLEYQNDPCAILTDDISKILNPLSVKIIGDYYKIKEIHKSLMKCVETHFNYPKIQSQLTILELHSVITTQISPFSFKNLTLKVSNNTSIRVSDSCLKHLRYINIFVESFERNLIFDDLNCAFDYEKFSVILKSPYFPYFENFYQNYRDIFQIQKCNIHLLFGTPKYNINCYQSILIRTLNEIPQSKVYVSFKCFGNVPHSQMSELKGCILLTKIYQRQLQLEVTDYENLPVFSMIDPTFKLNLRNLTVNSEIKEAKRQLRCYFLEEVEVDNLIVFNLDRNIEICEVNEKIQCPKIIQIAFGIKCTNWAIIVVQILGSLVNIHRLNELVIKISSKSVASYEEIIILKMVLDFVSKCPNMQKLTIPYTTDFDHCNLLLNTLPCLQKSLKSLTLKHIDSRNQEQNLNIKFLFEIISKEMHLLRNINLQLCSFQNIEYEKLISRDRMAPLHVKITCKESNSNICFNNIDTRSVVE
ncbi:hypothetical protein FGO68_gene10653 [Halteria grandinella]|uniref:Uncharacterized protein n=1 Tax=Halteria grandinella TaxID=5974 RepID=A0A8J8SWX0_HALGN|nr:hypothetical protein FGO68_gene10653 [Halteria grandinella]